MISETLPIGPDCPALIWHTTELVVVQEVVLQDLDTTWPVRERSAAPKFTPLIVKEDCPVVGPFGLINVVTTGDVYENTESLVPTEPLAMTER